MLDRHTTVVAITQSGETADTLAGIRLAKERGAKVLSICNVMGSSIARASDAVLYTHAGPEIAVASTKAYTSQITALLLLTLYLARRRKQLRPKQWAHLLQEVARLPELVRQTLATESAIKRVAARHSKARNFYFLGRRYNYPSALEGALKLKEICPLIHAEGYAAGEMKHGPISLIRKGWPVVFVAPHSPVYEKVVSNIGVAGEPSFQGKRFLVLSGNDADSQFAGEAVVGTVEGEGCERESAEPSFGLLLETLGERCLFGFHDDVCSMWVIPRVLIIDLFHGPGKPTR